MVPEFASNVAHCDNILVSLIRLRPRVKLSTRTTHILCSHRLAHLVFKMWHVRTLDALVGEYDCEQDTDDEMPGLGYSSGEDSDMDMGEEVGEEMGEAVDMDEGMGEAGDVGIVDAAWWTEQQQPRFFQSPMKEDADHEARLQGH